MAQKKQKYAFVTLLILALVVSHLPYLNWPFSWMGTYFHEISHAIVAVFTNGQVSYCELHWQGSGRCLVGGGFEALIAFAGYFGAVVWGSLIYLIASGVSVKTSHYISTFLAVLTMVSLALWARDMITIFILLVLFGVFILAIFFSKRVSVNWFLQFIGLSVLLGATETPIALIDGLNVGDAAILNQITQVPEILWVGIWELFALLALFFLWKWSFKTT